MYLFNYDFKIFSGARGANLWLRNSKGDLPLHEAVASGRRELVKWLLDGRPSQVNATNHEGRTPLHIAAATDNADLCRLLLDRGAEVNPVARSSKNEPITPLDCATTRGHRSTAKYLQMHGGLPASKLANTEIVIDGAPITALPTRRVTSTKIDVHDRIRIEKREVVELSSPVQDRRRLRDKNGSDSSNESSADNRNMTRNKSEVHKYRNNNHKERRKRLMHTQKSFSDGYDSEFEGYERENSRDRKHKNSKKNRSKSEPARRHKRSARHHHRYRSRSGSSSDSESYSEKKKKGRHRRRGKRKSSSPSESSSSESSERRSTKRKGKKTSIHIEHDDEKQSVNIVKYKNTDNLQGNEKTDNVVTDPDTKAEGVKSEPEKEENKIGKNIAHSETETDTLSVKTNMVITEAQIHMERQSSQLGNSEINVTVDSSNNVSIETTNLSVTHKDLTEETKPDPEKLEIQNDDKESLKDQISETPIGETKTEPLQSEDVSAAAKQNSSNEDDHMQSNTLSAEDNNQSHILDELAQTQSSNTQSEQAVKTEPNQTETSYNVDPLQQASKDLSQVSGNELKTTPSSNLEQSRRKSFQVLSGPDETTMQSKDLSGELKTSCDVPSIEHTETQEKSSSPAVSFSNKDEIIEGKESNDNVDHLMGESVDHSLDPETDKQVQDSILQKDSSGSNVMSSEERRKDFSSTTGSSTENQINDKGLVSVLDDDIPTSDRAVQEVILENLSEEFDVNLSLAQSSPKRIRKSSKESQGSSRKSSIYETESYKVLSDIASAPDVTPGILKKTSIKMDEGSLEDDRELFDGDKLSKDLSRVPSISDNELYSHSEANGRRKRFRKKGRSKSRSTIRSKSENSERGYESSGLMDSGFEPSPRAIQRRITSPRLAAYYQQRNASGRFSGKSDSRIPVRKPGDKNAVDMKSVTQRIQTNMRRYVENKTYRLFNNDKF